MSTLNSFVEKYGRSINISGMTKAEREEVAPEIVKRLSSVDEYSVESICLCLDALKILCRDRALVSQLASQAVSRQLLSQLVSLVNRQPATGDPPDREVSVGSLKCLFNMLMSNAQAMESMLRSLPLCEHILDNLSVQDTSSTAHHIQLFGLKILFLMTCFWKDYRTQLWSQGVSMAALNVKVQSLRRSSSPLSDEQAALTCEVLKVLYNLTLSATEDSDSQIVCEAMDAAAELAFDVVTNPRAACPEQSLYLQRHAMGLTANLQTQLLKVICVSDSQPQEGACSSRLADAGAIERARSLSTAIVEHLQKILILEKPRCQEFLPPVCMLSISASRNVPEIRRQLRQEILPPLKDEVMVLPTEGDSLRNRLCTWMTSHSTEVAELVSTFLFVLCKEKVDRLIKYTGMGNAAGFLSQHGLFGRQSSDAGGYSSDSGSDTEEYAQLEPHVNPVTGRVEAEKENPFDRLSDEQKEAEVMGLVNAYQKMLDHGVVKPARVGEDGQVYPLEHVTQLMKDPQPEESEDSD